MLAWATDDSGYILRAMDEYNFRTDARVERFGQLKGKPAIDGKSPESWILIRAAELKRIDKN